MKTKYLIILLSITFLSSGCETKSSILAKVRGESITLKEFEEQFHKLPPAYQSTFITPKQKEKFLDQMITEKLLIQEAIKEGLHRKKEIQEKVKWFKKQLLIEELIKMKVYDKTSISDEEAKKYYDAHQKDLNELFKGKKFDEIKQNIKQLIQIDGIKSREIFNKWIEGLKKEAKITKNLTLFGTIEKEEKRK